MAYKPPPPIPAMNIHWKPPGMTLVAHWRLRSPHTLFKARLQALDMNYPAIALLLFVFRLDVHPYPAQGSLVAKVKLRLYLPHGQPPVL